MSTGGVTLDSTKVSLLVALAVAVMSIPIAYMMGERSTTDQVKELIRDELPRLRASEPGLGVGEELTESEDVGEVSDSSQQGEKEVEGETARAVDTEGPVSVETYRQLRTGMSYEEVVGVLGRPGVQMMSMVDRDGTRTVSFEWAWDDGFQTPGRVTVSFVNGKLDDRSYNTR